MAEGGFGVLEKVFADRHIVWLANELKDGATDDRFPQLFRNAVAVQVETAERKSLAPPQGEILLDWYELTESCESSLFNRGFGKKWQLPCVVTTGKCECPFIPHAARQDWEALHALAGTKMMKWLLTQCSIFVLVGGRAWLQISGPLDKGGLEKAFPFAWTFRGGSKAVKRKRKEEEKGEENKAAATVRPGPIRETFQRPAKKIRLVSSDGQIQRLTILVNKTEDKMQKIDNKMDVPPSLVPQLKKTRVRRRDSLPVAILSSDKMEPQEKNDHALILPEKEPDKKKKKTRRGRNKLAVRQIVDKRRAVDGSILIPHDEILYSSSGWTHFPNTHPLFRSPNDTIAAILNAPVGTECRNDQLDLTRLSQLVEVMGKNHRRCRYTPIFRRMLIDSDYDPKISSVGVGLVYRFIKCVVKKVVPVQLLGDIKNQRIFLSNVRRFVQAGRGTAFTLNDFIESMRTSKCLWLIHSPSLPVQISLMARLITWLFMDFVKPLIRQHFYATETTFGKNRIFFYTKDVWQRIHHRMMSSMCAVSLRQPLPVLQTSTDEENLTKLLIRARLRFVPKKNGSRPIMSTQFREGGRNQINSARLLLSTISGEYAEGMDAKSTHSLHRKWAQFVKRGFKDPVYFVHADIEDAFGSIRHDKMVDILRYQRGKLPRELQVRKFTTVSPDGRRSKSFPVIPHFHKTDPDEWVQRLKPGTVVFDVGVRSAEVLDTHSLIEFAMRSVREVNVVHDNKTHYRLSRGIPQGSPLSSALCHIYYGQMVREHLSTFLNHPDDLLIRVVDDFLYLTTCGERARDFHKRIHQGFIPYNAYVNIDKSATNLDLSKEHSAGQAPPVRKPIWSSFCGLQFNTRTLEIRGDYCKYEGTDVIYCITPSAGKPGQLLLKRLQGISTLKIEVSFLSYYSTLAHWFLLYYFRLFTLTAQWTGNGPLFDLCSMLALWPLSGFTL